MDIETQKKVLQENLRRSGLSETQITILTQEKAIIANEARRQMREDGAVTVTCPKCMTHPVVSETTERMTIRCSCGYIADGEIYL